MTRDELVGGLVRLAKSVAEPLNIVSRPVEDVLRGELGAAFDRYGAAGKPAPAAAPVAVAVTVPVAGPAVVPVPRPVVRLAARVALPMLVGPITLPVLPVAVAVEVPAPAPQVVTMTATPAPVLYRKVGRGYRPAADARPGEVLFSRTQVGKVWRYAAVPVRMAA